MHIVIMAGGVGQRFWPLSTPSLPKQCLSLLGERSLVQDAVSRAQMMTDNDRILVVTGPQMETEIRSQLPMLPAANIIIEPSAKNTAPCIALAAFLVADRGGKELMFWPADHYIGDTEMWIDTCCEALRLASQKKTIALVGIVPDRPHSGYGHLCLKEDGCSLSTFIEKPALDHARTLMENGNVLWNAGVCGGNVHTLLAMIQRHWFEGFEAVDSYRRTLDRTDWNGVPSISFDYAVLEKMSDLAVHQYGGTWSDLGDWNSIEPFLPKTAYGRGVAVQTFVKDGHENLLYSPNKPIAVLGLNEVVVVDGPDGLLIMSKAYAQQVREAPQHFEGLED